MRMFFAGGTKKKRQTKETISQCHFSSALAPGGWWPRNRAKEAAIGAPHEFAGHADCSSQCRARAPPRMMIRMIRVIRVIRVIRDIRVIRVIRMIVVMRVIRILRLLGLVRFIY